MKFLVIYTVDAYPDVNLRQFQPPHLRSDWTITEKDDQADFDYAGLTKHRKYVAEHLSEDRFKEFIQKTDLYAEDVETMGSLGWWGWQPAISFTTDYWNEEGVLLGAYVTPFPEDATELNEETWEKVRKQIIEEYGY